MSFLSALLFSQVQQAGFYRAFHEEAVGVLGRGEGRTWLDVGSGPGLIPELAAASGFQATGADIDPATIRAARKRVDDRAAFRVSSLDALVSEGRRYDVVSASSLLVVLDDPGAALQQLQRLVRPGGTLLVIEASERFTLFNVLKNRASLWRAGGGLFLLLWLSVRSGRTLSSKPFRVSLEWSERRLLLGMVNGWTFVARSEPSDIPVT